MRAIYEKELSSYFHNPLGFLYLAVYYLFGGQFFLMQVRFTGTNDISGIFSNLYMIVLFSLPLLTMKLMADEKRQRTDQALFTAPVSLTEIILGKFLAAYTLFGIGIGICILYFIVLSALSSPAWSIFIGNFLGMLLLGGALTAIGLFVSSLTESQVLAAVGTFGCIFTILLLDSIGSMLPSGLSFLEKPLEALSFSGRYYDFTAGIVDPSNILFFVSVMAAFLFLTVCVLDKNRQVTSRWVKNTSFAAVFAALFIAVLVLVNVVFSMGLKRLPSLDLTENGIYQLSTDSEEILDRVDIPVEIIVCYDENDLRSTEYGLQMDELLKGYERENSHISVRFADILKEPELSSEYADYGVSEGSVILHSSLRTKVIALNDCVQRVTASNGYGYTYSSRAEQALTSGILYVTEHETVQVTVLAGHSEIGCDDMMQYLSDNNYEIKEQNIATEEIDDQSAMVFLLAPTSDYTPEELKKLDKYLDNSGNFDRALVYVASHKQPVLPNLESFLDEWGIHVGSSLIVETDTANAYDSQGFMFGASFTEDAGTYLAEVKNPALPFLGYYCRPLQLLFQEQDNRTAVHLVESSDSCMLYPLQGEEGGKAEEHPGAQGIVALGSRIKYIGTEKHTAQVAVFASTAMFSSSSTVGSSFNNQDFTVELLNSLSGKQGGISIPDVSFETEKLNVTQSQFNTMSLWIGILLPLAVFAAGIVIWIRRRRL